MNFEQSYSAVIKLEFLVLNEKYLPKNTFQVKIDHQKLIINLHSYK